ncbi:protein kinase domain-containing protein [Nonomuraea sp. LPB2021202275-12-8]|uniref:protein kinase domain-containing protein n=1 Tax=Nonomuraea sp. LPB2021202275-12-8 TaxID=3120159 RepID=UPI00300D6AA7
MDRQVGNRYRLIEPLGEGGMGVVWRAYDELLDRTVAIKEVRYTGVGEAKRAELNGRTIREARAAGRLDHPSVIVIHDVVEEDGRPWIVMQLVRSRSLAEVIRERGPLPVQQVATVGARVLDALRAAHATGVLHRDVKPENVLLADDGRVVLTDFGIASLEAEAGLTATGGLVGTPAYMPPERLNGEPARPESDLWSLGATLYAAAEGEPPFRRDSWAATVAAVLRDPLAPPRRAGALTPVIVGLLKRDPATRMSAAQAAELLAKAAAPADGTVPVTLPRPRGRRRWVTLAAAAAAVMVLGAGGALLATWFTATPRTGDAGPAAPPAEPTTEPTRAPTGQPTVQPTRQPTRQPSGQPTGRQLPEGWRAHRNTAGRFSIAVPRGWRVAKHPSRDSVTLSGPGTTGRMIVEWTVPDKPWTSAVQHWRALEQEIKDKGEFPGYRRIGIRPVRYLGQAAADWEFTRPNGGTLIHVINRGFRTADGRPFALYWEAPHSRWERDRHYFDTFVETFQPAAGSP